MCLCWFGTGGERNFWFRFVNGGLYLKEKNEMKGGGFEIMLGFFCLKGRRLKEMDGKT